LISCIKNTEKIIEIWNLGEINVHSPDIAEFDHCYQELRSDKVAGLPADEVSIRLAVLLL